MTGSRRMLTVMALMSLGALQALPQGVSPDDHIVSPSAAHHVVATSAQTRQQNLAKIERLFASDPAQKAFKSMKLDPEKISHAVSSLSDEEVASLARRTEQIQNDLAAGALTNQQITYILIALGTAVIILVLVAAR